MLPRVAPTVGKLVTELLCLGVGLIVGSRVSIAMLPKAIEGRVVGTRSTKRMDGPVDGTTTVPIVVGPSVGEFVGSKVSNA